MKPGNSLLVGQIALELGLLTEAQLQDCLSFQAGQPQARPIGALLVESGILRPEQMERIVAEQQRRLRESVPYAVATKAEISFGRLLVKGGHASDDHVNEALRAQQDFAERGVRKRLGELLVEAGRLSPQTVLAVLAQQGKTVRACTFCGAHFNVLLAVADRFPCRKCGMAMSDTLASIRADETSFLLPAVDLLPRPTNQTDAFVMPVPAAAPPPSLHPAVRRLAVALALIAAAALALFLLSRT